MVDPVSIIGLVATALQASTTVYDLIKGAKDAPQDVQEILRESTAVHNFLLILKKYLDNVQEVAADIEGGLRLPLENTELALRELAETVKPFIDAKTFKWRSFKWVFKQKEIDGLKRELKNSQATLSMAISIIVKSDTSTISSHTMSMMGTQSEILDIIKHLDGKVDVRFADGNQDRDLHAGMDPIVLSKYLESIPIAEYSPPPTNAAGMSIFDEDLDDASPPPELTNHVPTASQDKEDEINQLLLQSPDRCTINDDGQTALHLAAQANAYLLRRVLNQGYPIDEPNIEGETPLMSAVIAENLETVKLLLKHGANTNARSENGKTSLHYAAAHNKDMTITQLLLQHGAITEATDRSGHSPLFTATIRGNDIVCKQLLASGANVKSYNGANWTALHYLAMRGTPAFMDHLLSSDGPDVEAFYEPERFGLQTSTAHDTSSKRKIGLTKLFLDHGIDINDHRNGYTALHLAVLTGQDHLITTLLSHNASATGINLACVNQGLSPSNLVQLLHRGANIEASDSKWNKTPLLWASETGSQEAVQILLDHGADVNVQDKQGISALRYASANARPKIVQLLLSKGADPSLGDCVGRTPLIGAAFGRPFWLGGRFYNPLPDDRAETTALLLAAGADISSRDIWDDMAIHHAAKNGYLGVMKELGKCGGCDLGALSNGRTALQMAEEKERETRDVVRWLKRQLVLRDAAVKDTGLVQCQEVT